MEEWQIDYIKTNLVGLVRTKKCSVEVKCALIERGLLTDEDFQNLSIIGRQESPIAEAKALYDLLMKKDNGYSNLMEVLELTRQSGAMKILKSGSVTSMAEALMRFKVEIFGYVMGATEAVPKLTVKDVEEFLENSQARREIEECRKRKTVLELDPVLPETNPLYIPRRISNRVELDPEVFKRKSPDVFVFKGLTKDELKALVAPHWVMSSNEQLSCITHRHIFLDDEEDWNDLALMTRAPLHLITKEVIDNKPASNQSNTEIYVVTKSTEVSQLLQEACQKMPGRRRDVYISEGQFVDQQLSSDNINGACLCDVPGMGKSWLLQNLARSLKDASQNSLAFYTNLSSFSEYLEQNNATQKDDPLLEFLKHGYSTSLAAFLMHRYITDSDIRAYLFLDGYDEILDSRLERTNSMLQSMHSSHSNVKMIITSRLSMRATLEVNCGVISYDILPFDTAEQVSAMTSIWQQKFPEHNLERLKEYAAHCTMITKNIKASNDPDILGVPLKCYLLAIVSEKNAGQFSDPKRKKQVNLSEMAISTSVFDLYQEFVDAMLKKVKAAEDKEFEIGSWRESVLYYHTLHAFNLLYPEIGRELSAILPEIEIAEEELKKIGMLAKHGSKMTFIHRTFAEYFAGRFVADLLTSGGQETIAIVIARKALFTKLLCTHSCGEETLADIFEFDIIASRWPEMKITKFTETTVLWFMDRRLILNLTSSCSPHEEVSNLTYSLYEVIKISFSWMWPSYEMAFFKDSLFQILMCCIREGYHHIIKIIMQIMPAKYYWKYFSTIFRSKSASNQLTTRIRDGAKNSELVAVCILLLQLAQYASEETAYEIYNLFTQSGINFFRQIFHRSSSALKHRIVSVTWTYQKYIKSRDWFLPFLIETKLVEKSEWPITEIVEAVFRESESRFEDKLNSSSLAKACSKWIQIKSSLLQSGINLQTTSLQYKAQVMDYVLYEVTDSELVVVLLDLFGQEEESKKFWATQHINPNDLQDVSQSDVVNVRLWKAEEVLKAIDIKDASHVLSAIKFDNSRLWFYALRGLEILKVLLSIWKDMRNNAVYNWDYLHWAVLKKNVDWVRYLLENDRDVNAIDKYGGTPLHLVRSVCPLKITELLLDHGADVYAVDKDEDNVVHAYYSYLLSSKKSGIVEWTTFMLDRGHHKLWSMKNWYGKTPMDYLAETYDVAFCNEIASLVKKYEVLSQEKATSESGNESGNTQPVR